MTSSSQESPENTSLNKAENDLPSSVMYIVGIGASAGGLDALERFFQQMPSDSGLAFVIVQHLSPNFKSMMGELLARHTKMKIHQVDDGIHVEPNHIYLIPPRKDMVLKDKQLFLSDRQEGEHLYLPIDTFFKSLAEDVGEHAIAIILSGTGSDGSRGIAAISQANGLVLAQDETSAGFDGMPRSAITTGLVNIVSRPEEMPKRLLDYLQHPDFLSSTSETPQDVVQEENEISLIFAILQKQFKIDFSQYKMATILRRINRRMMLTNVRDVMKYIGRLENDPDELNSLYRDLLVEVTRFFRDPEAFEVLRERIVPEIVDHARTTDEIRVWVPGCATGEEAYSIAMLFHEHLDAKQISRDIKIFATDVHQQSLDSASLGVYTEQAIQGLPDDYLKKYFEQLHETYRVRKSLRKMVIFAPHNLIHDPPFTKLDLISCRNVLIYFQSTAQERVLSRFHFGLKTGGYLILGGSEYIGELEEEFRTVSRRWRIFNKWRDVRLPEISNLARTPLTSAGLRMGIEPPRQRRVYREDWAEGLLHKFVPDGFLVNDAFELIHVFGNGRQFLQQPTGEASLNVLRMLARDLQSAVRAAVHQATKNGQDITYSGIQHPLQDELISLKVTVSPIKSQHKTSSYFLVCFTESDTDLQPPPKTEKSLNVETNTQEHVLDLERELLHTKEYLQTTIEELETTNEELQSANEELIASNEELQSTNEELHSVNEELHTVNSEYQRKIDELSQITNDMKNLHNSSGIGVVFLNENLQIREFTPAAAGIFNLLPQDVGRPIEHLLYRIPMSQSEMADIANDVIAQGKTITKEIEIASGDFFLLQALPYQDENNDIQGLLLTFTNINELKSIEQSLLFQEQNYQSLFEHAPNPVWIQDLSQLKQYLTQLQDGDNINLVDHFANHPEEIQHCANLIEIIDANAATLAMYRAKNKDSFYAKLSDTLDDHALQTFRDQLIALAQGQTTFVAETTNRTLDGHSIDIQIHLSIPPHHLSDWSKVYVSAVNISKRKRAEQELTLSEAQYRALSAELEQRVHQRTKELEDETAALLSAQNALKTSQSRLAMAVTTVGLGIYEHVVSPDSHIYHNEMWAKILGFSSSDLPPLSQRLTWFEQQIHPDDLPLYQQSYAEFIAGKQPEVNITVRVQHRDGHWIYVYVTTQALEQAESGQVTRLLGLIRDISQSKKAENALRESVEKYQILNEALETRVSERTSALENSNQQLNAIIEQHELTLSSLKTSEQKFSDFIELSPGGILIVNIDGRIVQANKATESLFGYSRSDLVGQPIEMLLHQDDQDSHLAQRKAWLQNPQNGLMREGRRVNGRHQDGHLISVLVDLSVFSRKDDFFIITHISDMSLFQEAEAELANRAQELAQSNEELESFAYIVSHDLRAPLRAMKGYSTFLREDYEDQFDEEGKEFIQGIFENANRLDQLLQDILTYSRVGRREEPLATINIHQLVNSFVENVLEKNGHQFDIADNLPSIHSYPTRIHQIFSNLLSNAVKYSSDVSSPKVSVSWEDRGDYFAFSVQDNGIGIDKKHLERIFGVFQRLHTDEEYEGTGIGLAIVQKSITQLGGEIEVISAKNKGSTFTFTIPKVTKND